MPRVINLDALIVDTVTVNVRMPDGQIQTFELKDDIPMEVGMQTFALMQQADFLQHVNEKSPDEVTQQFALLDTNTTHILGEIFRHTYPGMTDEELTSLLPFNARLELVKAFFTSLMRQFSRLPTATDSLIALPPSPDSPGRANLPMSAEVAPPENNDISQDETPSPNDSTEAEGQPVA